MSTTKLLGGVRRCRRICELCATVAAQVGLPATSVSSAELALEVLEQSAVDILLVDFKLPGMSGLDLLKRVTELYRQISMLVLTQRHH